MLSILFIIKLTQYHYPNHETNIDEIYTHVVKLIMIKMSEIQNSLLGRNALTKIAEPDRGILELISHGRAAKAQASLRARAASPERSLLAYTQKGRACRLRPNLRFPAH